MGDGVALGRPRTVAIVENAPNFGWLLEAFAQDAGFEVQLYATYDGRC